MDSFQHLQLQVWSLWGRLTSCSWRCKASHLNSPARHSHSIAYRFFSSFSLSFSACLCKCVFYPHMLNLTKPLWGTKQGEWGRNGCIDSSPRPPKNFPKAARRSKKERTCAPEAKHLELEHRPHIHNKALELRAMRRNLQMPRTGLSLDPGGHTARPPPPRAVTAVTALSPCNLPPGNFQLVAGLPLTPLNTPHTELLIFEGETEVVGYHCRRCYFR